ncbi:hypothetical protein BH11ARM1_BH11ARM1_14970 [soil metagenome]
MISVRPIILIVLVGIVGTLLAGCSSGSTDDKKMDDAYRSKDKPKPPTAEQFKPKGQAFIGEPTGGGPSGGSATGGPAAGGPGPG